MDAFAFATALRAVESRCMFADAAGLAEWQRVHGYPSRLRRSPSTTPSACRGCDVQQAKRTARNVPRRHALRRSPSGLATWHAPLCVRARRSRSCSRRTVEKHQPRLARPVFLGGATFTGVARVTVEWGDTRPPALKALSPTPSVAQPYADAIWGNLRSE